MSHFRSHTPQHCVIQDKAHVSLVSGRKENVFTKVQKAKKRLTSYYQIKNRTDPVGKCQLAIATMSAEEAVSLLQQVVHAGCKNSEK